jgi:prostaglandin-endoperoxide synthase 2
MVSDDTTWTSLTNRSCTGRHLPPADPSIVEALPPEADVTALFRRH